MNMEEQFNLIAKEYDEKRKKFIPCFDDYYKNSTKFIAANIKEPVRFLDLGAGTGLLSYFWYLHYPNTEYVLVDIAEEMLRVAEQRFKGIESVSTYSMDYTEELPKGDFDMIGSALSIHHLEDVQKEELFARIYKRLPESGMFVNYDQFCAEEKEMRHWFDAYWEHQLEENGLSEEDLRLWRERRKLDKECSVESEIRMLKNAGFKKVSCIYTYQKFAVITARK